MDQIIKTIQDKIGLSLEKTNRSENILFFTGAGISAPDPCAFPLGNELHNIILKAYSGKTREEILATLENIPFEQTIEEILNREGRVNHQNDFLNRILELLIYKREDEFKEQKDYHKFFNKHIRSGGTHITVNLDQFIELDLSKLEKLTARELDDSNIPVQADFFSGNGLLFKIHGDPTIDYLGFHGFLQSIISQGLSERVQSLLDKKLAEAKVIIFVGYGGVDEFDITPYFEAKNPNFFEQTSALWINYSSDDEVKIKEDLFASQEIISSRFNRSLCVECAP